MGPTPRPAGSRRRLRAAVALGAAALVALAGCSGGSDSSAPTTSPTPIASTTTEPELTPRLEGNTTIIDPGGEAVACFGPVRESSPPTCGGSAVALEGWRWGDLPDIQTAGDAKWAEYHIIGYIDPATDRLRIIGTAAPFPPPEDDGPPTTAPVGTRTSADALRAARKRFEADVDRGRYDLYLPRKPASRIEDGALVANVVWAPQDLAIGLAQTYRVPVRLDRSLVPVNG